MIGKHFPEVGDKLTNLLDLAEDSEQSELLLASIAQRSKQMDSVPFSSAIDFKDAIKYVKYSIIPIVIVCLLYLTGNWSSFFGTYERVVNYEMAYEKPAPFQFHVLTDQLSALQNESFTIQVSTNGKVKPENVYIVVDGKPILMQKQDGIYEYTFSPPIQSTNFTFLANEVNSKSYSLIALKTPSILDFSMDLKYPTYLNKPNETIKSTGNAILPEGTQVTWNIEGENTEKINLNTKDTVQSFIKEKNTFTIQRKIYNDLDYELTTTNVNVQNYERLEYSFKVIKDAYPTLKVNQVLDSLNPNVSYYTGNASDDYGLSKIELVYFEVGKENQEQKIDLAKPSSNFEQFYYTFPSGLALESGKQYAFYFQVTDNDAIHHGKAIKSQIFQQVLLNENQLKNKDLESQQSLIKDLDKSLERAKQQKESLEEINQNQKEKSSLNFNDQNQIKDYLKKQEQQEQLMQKFSKELKENLDKGNKDDKLNQLLQERLERQEQQAKKNQQLLEELNKVADKIKKEELTKKLEELGKKQQNSERSLEQLLELTKRYYVTEKASQLARDLEELAKKQEELSKKNKEENSSIKQQQLNKAFNELSKEMDGLKNDNKKLKKPIDLNLDTNKKEAIKEDQNEALDELQKQENSESKSTPESDQNNASKKQKSAAQKMKEMSEQLSSSSSSSSGGSSVAEDAEMLRQILDNLIIFSFKQESLFDKLSAKQDQDQTQYSQTVRDQNELRGLFEHVDDSLFALSLRQAELSEFVNEQITEVYYNIDKSLETMADGQLFQGISHQKYVLTASNSLADFLANVMDNMQESMQMGKGSGQNEGGFQLPDIIKGQQQLGEKMGQQGQSGKKGKSGEGEKGSKGEQGEGGKQGENGEQGQNGKSGENGSEGENGQNGKNGNGGQKGENGQGNGKGNSNGNGGQGNGQMSEAGLKEIYEIYQSQQKIRQELEKQLENMINSGDQKLGQKLIKQMEDFENDLLENGITERTINKANTIQYELLKLENAALKQGEKSERESNRNTKDFTNPITTKPSLLENYHNEVEILNRQSLPLRQNFQTKVKEYFKAND
ncbi:Collagen triple helix repeat-containing protein [Maribacter dokdonensis DSW-8]|nr:Collagen triple helix repeat-containing protein [Maribacter dokdonensis DSW-8]